MDAMKYLTSRREALKKFLHARDTIEKAADGTGPLPEPDVMRAACCYLAGDFCVFLDGIDEGATAKINEGLLPPLLVVEDRTPEQLVADGDAPCDVCRGNPALGFDADPNCPRCKGKGQLTIEQLKEKAAEADKRAEAERRAENELKLLPDNSLLHRFSTEGYATLTSAPPVTFAMTSQDAFWLLQFVIIGLGTQGAKGDKAAGIRDLCEKVLGPATCSTPLLRELTRRGWDRVDLAHPKMKIGPRVFFPPR